MPIDTQGAYLSVQPLSPIQLGSTPNGNLLLEQQRLQLMQQEFEETKRRNAENDQLHQMEEQGRMKREQMLQARQEQQQAAAQAAAQQTVLEANKHGAYLDMMKYRDAGDYEGMDMAANLINQYGGRAERTGQDSNGLPTYQIDLNGQQAAQADALQQAQAAPVPGNESIPQSLNRLNALGFQPGRGGVPTDPGIAANDPALADRFQAAVQARAGVPLPSSNVDPTSDAPDALSSQAGLPGSPEMGPPTAEQAAIAPEKTTNEASLIPGQTHFAPVRGPDAADYMSSVPKNVIDTGAMAAQERQRLGPVMANIEASMPAAYRDSTRANDAAAMGLGLPPLKTMEEARALRAPADAATEKGLAADAKAQEEAAKLAAAEPVKAEAFRKGGEKTARTAFKDQEIETQLKSIRDGDTVARLLTADPSDKDYYLNQEKAINLLMRMDAQVGAQSEPDALRMTGLNVMSTTDQVKEWFNRHVNGAMWPPIVKEMKRFATDMQEQSRARVYSYIDSMTSAAEKEANPLVGEGYHRYLRTLPRDLLEGYDKESGNAPGQSPPRPTAPDAETPTPSEPAAETGSLDESIKAAAERADLDPAKIAPLVGKESKGSTTATNAMGSGARGTLQWIDSTARQYDNPRTGKRMKDANEYATLSRDEQMALNMKYFKDRGITKDSPREAYALAVAAPGYIGKPRDTVIAEYHSGTKDGDLVRKQNPHWIPKDGSEITVGSILDYYGLHGDPKAAATTASATPGKDDNKLLRLMN